MAKAGHGYPQVVPRAEDLIDARVRMVSRRWSAERALAAALASGTSLVADDARRVARVRDLRRAVAWGLGRRRWTDLAWTAAPLVSSGADEVSVRRLFVKGASMILVRDGRRLLGAIQAPARPPRSLGSRLDRGQGARGEAKLWLLRTAGKLGEAHGQAVYVAGGTVRDLMLSRIDDLADVDLVLEGDGIDFGRRLGEETGGHLTVHAAFGTVSLEGGATPDGTPLGRVDIATARREHYREPGALPEVSPAGIDEDLGRRDFSVNAMAVALAPSAWGRLYDPHGGAEDVVGRRLRVLHPLSFVEDPTRIWRGARYAARLGLRPDAGFARALGLAIGIGHYPALSGQRLRAELELVMAEAEPWRALALLLGWGAFRLWDASYRVTRASRARLASARAFLGRARRSGVTVDATQLALLVLLFDQPRRVTERCLRRLAVAGGHAARVHPAASRELGRRLVALRPRRPSRVAAVLRPARDEVVLGAWLSGGRTVRREVEWFLREGRGARPLSSGEDVVAAGVPRGPLVGQALGWLRDRRLDGRVRTLDDERAALVEWVRALATKGDPR